MTAAGKPEPHVPAPRAVTTRAGARRIVIGAVVAALSITAVVLVVRGSDKKAEAPSVAPDVPHVEGRAIVLTKGFRERTGIKTVPIKRAPLSPAVKVVGMVTFDPEHVAAVGTRIKGLVRKLAKIEGDSVKAGEVLGEIESAELAQAQASVAMIEAQRKAAAINATRERDLAKRKLSTEREAEVAEASLAEYRAMLSAAQQKTAALGGSANGGFGIRTLHAPIEGTIVERHVSAGQFVDDNVVAFRVANLDHLWVELAVFERHLDVIKKGDKVEVRPLSNTSLAIEGKVAHVGQEIDRSTRSAAIRIKVPNHEGKLRPGQSVNAIIRASAPAREALVVPVQAVTYVDGKPTLFVAETEDRILPTPVVLGASDGTYQEITDGIAEGVTVVSEGVFALKSELFR